ncbi:hypothetical protein C0416_01635 [bacterium]|nr:hypothetical protein [bacterium]
MKKIKILITGVVMVATIAIAGIASAETTSLTVTFDVDSVTTLTACSSIDLGTFSVHQGKDNSASPCNVIAASNDPDGFEITINGTNVGLWNSATGTDWDKLNINTGDMDTSCTGSCTEAWGFRIATGTASEYDLVEQDTNNDNKPFDAATCGGGTDKCWHTVNFQNMGVPGYVGPETIITNSGPTPDDTANFDLEIGMVAGSTGAGDYQDTITLTITPL